MKQFLFCGIILSLAAATVPAQEKTSLRMPLGLSPGISRDSTSTIFQSLGASLDPGREDNYRIGYSFAGIQMKKAIPIFLGSGLISVSMYSDRTGDEMFHIARLKEAFDHIKELRGCEIVEDNLTAGKLPSNLNNGIELASFSTEDCSVFLSSEYDSGEGYILNILLVAYPLPNRPSSKP